MRGKGMSISYEIKERRDARGKLLLRKLGIIRRTSWRGGASRRRPIQTAKQDSTGHVGRQCRRHLGEYREASQLEATVLATADGPPRLSSIGSSKVRPFPHEHIAVARGSGAYAHHRRGCRAGAAVQGRRLGRRARPWWPPVARPARAPRTCAASTLQRGSGAPNYKPELLKRFRKFG